MNGGTVIAQLLAEHGVRHVFTVCGGHISPILTECRRKGIGVVDVRNEATAVFAADAVSRLTGIPGVAVVTAGPGVANCLTPLVNASQAQSPLLVLGGAAATVLRGRGSLQDIDQCSIVRPAVKAVYTIHRNCDFIPVIEFALAFAASGVPGPVFIECPIDLLYDEPLVRQWYGAKGTVAGHGLRDRLVSWYLNRHLDRLYSCDLDGMRHESMTAVGPDIGLGELKKAARVLAAAEQPVLIVGSQALLSPQRAPSLAAAVERLGIPVYTTGMARGLLGADHPLLLRHHRSEALREADCVVLAGMPCDFRLDYGRSLGQGAKTVAVNRSRRDLTLNHRPTVAVHADPAEFIIALAGIGATAAVRPSWPAILRERETRRADVIRTQAGTPTEHMNPLRLLEHLDRAIDHGDTVVADGGDFVATASYIVRPRGPLSWLDPGVFGTLGVGAGFALGAKCCRPASTVWLIWGDGAAGYGLVEFDTFVRHGLPVIAVIGNDGAWSQIARDQVAYLGDDVATRLRRSDYHLAAKALGGEGILVTKESEIAPALASARTLAAAGTPVLINALIDAGDFRKGSLSM